MEYPNYAVKIRRAEEHIEALKQVVRRHVNDDFGRMRGEMTYDPQGAGLLNVRFSGETQVGRLLDISCVVGDVIHNLRSAMDHIAWQLAEVSGGSPGETTTFPVLKVPPSADRNGHHPPPTTPGGRDVKIAARKIIESVQVYNDLTRPVWEYPLWRLHRLDIIDKHRGLILGLTTVRHAGTGFAVIDPLTPHVPVTGSLEVTEYLDDGAVFRFVPDDPKVQVHSKIRTVVCIPEGTADAPEPLPVVTAVTELAAFVRDEIWTPLHPFVM